MTDEHREAAEIIQKKLFGITERLKGVNNYKLQ